MGATVVVANPVSAPQSDVRVPPVKLSADSTASTTALDRALLETLTRDASGTSPADPLKRVVAGVVTNVTMLSGRAVDEAFWSDVSGTPTPMRVPSLQSPLPATAVADLLSGKPATVASAGASPAVIEDRALQHAVTSVADYVGYVSVQVVEATVAAARIAVAKPRLIADTLAALTDGDVDAAITTALRVVAVPVGPPSKIVKAIRTEVRQRVTELTDILRRSAPSRPAATPTVTLSAVADSVASLRRTLGHRRGLSVTAKPGASSKPGNSTEPETSTKPEASADATDSGTVTGPDTKPTAANGATDLSDGNKAVPRTKAPQSPVQQRVENSVTQVRTSLDRFADTLRKALTPHRAPQRTGATPAPASDAS
ncbi:hypothetical protein Y900_019920 [Mycolicibacterium aromaticivorans JS19b1 = JCM 16368]|uniref:Uncharacterized protein n=1 Tax=Mycolicibacterium aromaticivorans JS19b1 = JCM 16368 TaxID=1440774 RepID=A0A064CLB9_9MYCO|nr:hypothetical protein [Mycolicibacterium aromaticivorans]KDF01141.1 hypothetical protein Y900_019920 [Mycolicibacterium aromaticivorans JS19b1 = JCM 16368]